MKRLPVLLSALSLFFLQCNKEKNPFVNNTGSYNHNRNVGASANDLLSGSKYNSIKIEIQYMPGYQPDAASVNNLVGMLNDRLNKGGGITVVQTQVASLNKTTLGIDDITSFENQHRTVFTAGSQLGVYFLFTDGGYTDNNVLGVAYKNTSMCIFGKTINDNSGGIGQTSRTKLSTTVLEHEFGHILGLVDVGTAMQTNHKDTAHGNHCNNSNCLMYYASETTDILGFLITGNIPVFDNKCLADLQANGGK